MSNQDKAKAKVADDATARVVDPANPLYINYTPATFDDIEIKGGQIYAQGDIKVAITKLTKTS